MLKLSNDSKNGRITAIGLNLPDLLKKICPELRYWRSEIAARNGGQPAPAGTEGYTLTYAGQGIEAGPAGRFDLLISAQGQKLFDTPNLKNAGIEPQESQVFGLQIMHLGLPVRPLDFVRRTSPDISAAFNIVARLETGNQSQLLRGVLPANTQSEFIRQCFAVLNRPNLIRKPSPKPQPSDLPKQQEEQTNATDGSPESQKTQDQPDIAAPDEAAARLPDLLTDAKTLQPPCELVELPRSGICYVAALPGHLPLFRSEFLQNRNAVLNSLMASQHQLLVNQWFNSPNIRQRTGLKAANSDQPQ